MKNLSIFMYMNVWVPKMPGAPPLIPAMQCSVLHIFRCCWIPGICSAASCRHSLVCLQTHPANRLAPRAGAAPGARGGAAERLQRDGVRAGGRQRPRRRARLCQHPAGRAHKGRAQEVLALSPVVLIWHTKRLCSVVHAAQRDAVLSATGASHAHAYKEKGKVTPVAIVLHGSSLSASKRDCPCSA